MRILILNYEYPPLGAGAGVVTRHLAERFAEKGHAVYILTTWYSGEPEYYVQKNITIIRLKSQRKKTFESNPYEMYSWLKHAIKYINQSEIRYSIDVTFANFTLPGGPVAKHLKKVAGIPYVILSHGHDVPWYSPPQMLFWHIMTFPWIKSVMKNAYRNVLLTDKLKASADKFLGESHAHKNVVIPNGMEVNNYRKGFNSADGNLRILFAGRLVEQKDPLCFLLAAKRINEMGIPVSFTMVGDGPLRMDIEKFIRQQDISNIAVLGKISQAELFELYSSHHIIIMTSKNEAMSLVALEALSNGLYLLSTNMSGIQSLLHPGITGEWINIGDDLQIAEEVKKFYSHKFLHNYQYPKDIAYFLGNEHHWEAIAERYLAVFRQAIGNDQAV